MKAKFELTSWGYEIDFYNASKKEIKFLSEKLRMNKDDIKEVFLKNGNEWITRICGMNFNISRSEYYSRLKEYLDDRLNLHLRKLKLLELNDKI